MSRSDLTADVAIIGGGIAGPGLAAALAASGLRILLIERDAAPPDTARGDHLQPATCERLARWDALTPMWRRGAEKRLGTRWVGAAGEPVLNVAVDELDIPHPYYLFLRHELISEALLERAAQNPRFVRLRPATARVGPADNGRHSLIVHVDGEACRVDAALIAAADGRASRIRRALDMPADVHAYENPLVIYFMPRVTEDPRNDVQAWLTDAGVISLVPRNGGLWKVGFPVPRTELHAWTKGDPRTLAGRLADLVPALAGEIPTLAGVYPVTMVTAERWVRDNVVLVGDACHAMHPGRSQGMNVALGAAAELAERIAAAGGTLDADAVGEILSGYDAQVRPKIAPRLAENHARGLAMDRMDRTVTQLLRKNLEQIAADPEKRLAYALNSAGY